MSYVHITKTAGSSLDDHERVVHELGDQPVPGQLLHIVGESDSGLVTVDVWETKTHADRFASERLFPAFERAGVRPGPGSEHLELDGTVTFGSVVGA